MCWRSGRPLPAGECLSGLSPLMQAEYPAQFSREMGCTAQELQSWLPGASRGVPVAWPAENAASVALEEGLHRLELRWQALPPRRIALITLPRLLVRFDFGQTSPAVRHHYMRHFDLYTQRGGG